MAVVTLVLLVGLIASLLLLWSRSYVRRQSELAQMDEERERAMLVHDASNAMMSMQLLVELADLEPDESSDAMKAVETLNDMLKMMRPGAQGLGDSTLAQAVHSAHAVFRRQAEIELEVAATGPTWPTKDARLLAHNLISNAAREAQKLDGTVRVHLEDGLLRVSNPVSPGTELGDEIYEEGVSGSGSTGLGLAGCRRVIESHGGSLAHAIEGEEITFTARFR